MTIIQSVFTSSGGLNCSANTCSALQRSLSLRTGVSAASRPLLRSLLRSQLLAFQTSNTDSLHACQSAQQLLQWSLSCLLLWRQLPNKARAPWEHLTLSWLILHNQFAHDAFMHFSHSLPDSTFIKNVCKLPFLHFFKSLVHVTVIKFKRNQPKNLLHEQFHGLIFNYHFLFWESSSVNCGCHQQPFHYCVDLMAEYTISLISTFPQLTLDFN